jgi:hypothetical protein
MLLLWLRYSHFLDAVPLKHLITVHCRITTLLYCNMICYHGQHALPVHEYMFGAIIDLSAPSVYHLLPYTLDRIIWMYTGCD